MDKFDKVNDAVDRAYDEEPPKEQPCREVEDELTRALLTNERLVTIANAPDCSADEDDDDEKICKLKHAIRDT